MVCQETEESLLLRNKKKKKQLSVDLNSINILF